MKIYVASSWRNRYQPEVVKVLEEYGHQVYDFRKHTGFRFGDIDPLWQTWSPDKFVRVLKYRHECTRGFWADFDGMRKSDAILLVHPAGRSSHLELGWGVGNGKTTAILMIDPIEPELMYKMVDHLLVGMDQLVTWAKVMPGGGEPDAAA